MMILPFIDWNFKIRSEQQRYVLINDATLSQINVKALVKFMDELAVSGTIPDLHIY